MSAVNYQELEMAVDFVSDGGFVNARAYICRQTGEIYWESDDSSLEELPKGLDDPGLYAEVPGKQDLNLGKQLVLKFAAQFVPDAYEEIDYIFRRRGAYSRFKELLHENGKLEEWYAFEQSAIQNELIDWAEMEGFVVEKIE